MQEVFQRKTLHDCYSLWLIALKQAWAIRINSISMGFSGILIEPSPLACSMDCEKIVLSVSYYYNQQVKDQFRPVTGFCQDWNARFQGVFFWVILGKGPI
ncbi:MAG: hypothetical protein C4534_07580 [Gaiellales bacterium]|nr:MAG: hypothetical protein C4534_07580 [Gaiellales bacterium]